MPERDDFSDFPGLARFGEALHDAALRAGAPRRRWWRGITLSLVVALGVATSATGTVVALRGTVISTPDPRVRSAAQTPLEHSAVLTSPRSADPAGGPPWALRLTSSETGQTCTTVGQVRDDVFGIVGQDGVFRQIPPAVTDACGRGPLLGSRIVSAPTARATRSIAYGVGGEDVRAVTMITGDERRKLELGERGTFVAALPGYPEDTAARVQITGQDGRVERHDLGARPGLVTDIDGAPAWRLARYELGSRQYCARLGDARGPADRAKAATSANGGRASTPTACISRRDDVDWAAQALRLRPGQKGVPGFDRWDYKRRPPRTVLLGVARASGLITRVTVTGAGAPRELTPAPNGTFALLLAVSVDPRDLRISVRLKDGSTQQGRPGHGIVSDIVPSRRPR